MSQLTREELCDRQEELLAIYKNKWPGLMGALRGIDPCGGWPQPVDAFKGISAPKEGSKCISKPFLLDMTAHNYWQASLRLFVVGKETADWETCKKIQGDPITYLLDIYNEFRLGAGYNSILLRTARRLYDRLNPGGPQDGFLWSNLNRVDEKGGAPQPEVAEATFKKFNVLPEELKLAKPDVVVFFTGPREDYERGLDATFDGLQREPVEGYECRVLARLSLPNNAGVLPLHTYLTYHPRYPRGRARRIEKIAALCEANN